MLFGAEGQSALPTLFLKLPCMHFGEGLFVQVHLFSQLEDRMMPILVNHRNGRNIGEAFLYIFNRGGEPCTHVCKTFE